VLFRSRTFGDGQTLGYGVSVAGLEVTGLQAQPLYVRGVDPLSPAAAAGVVRGDTVLAVNGRSSAEILAAAEPDFTDLTPSAAGQSLTLKLRNVAGTERTLTLVAALYAITPVPQYQVLATAGGRKLGYVEVRTMITQAQAPLANAFAAFRSQGVTDVVLDLRYNGGGLVSVGRTVASYVGGSRTAGQTYARLVYNDRQSSLNESFAFTAPADAAGAAKLYVLMGRRTCSASEQVINGLRGAGIAVVAIGEASCGKPVGFLPQSDSCGTTYSVVNFESVNARGEGRYFDWFAANCAVAENWSVPVGNAADPLLSAAKALADGGSCPAASREQPMSLRRHARFADGNERPVMLAR
jgi:C-terminal processing protease CtpA/Prc